MKNLRGYKQNKAENFHSAEQLKEYSNMSEDALFDKLLGEVSSAKSKGNFSAEELTQSVSKMKPYLSAEQSTKLDHLLRLITSE